MTSEHSFNYSCKEIEYFMRLFQKLLEDVEEAYLRTPVYISSRPYIERMLRLVQSGLSESILLMRRCRDEKL